VTVIGTSHHVTHHFGSSLPLGMIYNAYVEARDMNNGYKPDNAVTRWFLSEVERREGVDPEIGKKFLSLNDYFASKAPSTSPSTSMDCGGHDVGPSTSSRPHSLVEIRAAENRQ
jgi:hypothetical protein